MVPGAKGVKLSLTPLSCHSTTKRSRASVCLCMWKRPYSDFFPLWCSRSIMCLAGFICTWGCMGYQVVVVVWWGELAGAWVETSRWINWEGNRINMRFTKWPGIPLWVYFHLAPSVSKMKEVFHIVWPSLCRPAEKNDFWLHKFISKTTKQLLLFKHIISWKQICQVVQQLGHKWLVLHMHEDDFGHVSSTRKQSSRASSSAMCWQPAKQNH